jgi:hypothetical protein
MSPLGRTVGSFGRVALDLDSGVGVGGGDGGNQGVFGQHLALGFDGGKPAKEQMVKLVIERQQSAGQADVEHEKHDRKSDIAVGHHPELPGDPGDWQALRSGSF